MTDPTRRRPLGQLNEFETNVRQGLDSTTLEEAMGVFKKMHAGLEVLHEQEATPEDRLFERISTKLREELQIEQSNFKESLGFELKETKEDLEETRLQLKTMKLYDPFETGEALRTCQHGMNEALRTIHKNVDKYRLEKLLKQKTPKKPSKKDTKSPNEPTETQKPALQNSKARELLADKKSEVEQMNERRNKETHDQWPHMVARLLKSGMLKTRGVESDEWVDALEVLLYWAEDSTSLDEIEERHRPRA